MIVLGIETSTPQTSVALGSDEQMLGSISLAARRARHEVAISALERLLEWTGVELIQVGGVAVGIGPGLFTGLRVGVETGKSLAQTLGVPIIGVASLDALAFGSRTTRRTIVSAIDARRGEVYFGRYLPVPGGVARQGEFQLLSPEGAVAEIQASGEETLLVGNGATLYRHTFESELGGQVTFAPSALDHPDASSLVGLALPRFEREEHDQLFDIAPLYLRKSDAEIAWDQRAGSDPA